MLSAPLPPDREPTADALQWYCEGGYTPILISPRGKAPIEKSWNTTRRPLNAIRIAVEARGHNWGARLGETNIVFDVDPRHGGSESWRRLCERYPELCDGRYAVVITGSGGLHVLAKRPTDFFPRKAIDGFRGIDVKSSGQIVAAGSVHPNGRIYDHLFSPVSAADTAELTPALMELLAGDRPARAPAAPADPEPIERVRAALDALDPERFAGYGEWLNVGMATHAATHGSAEGLELWQTFSACIEGYDTREGQDECAAKWSSFRDKPNGVTFGTLAHLAKQAGAAVPRRPPTPPEEDFEPVEAALPKRRSRGRVRWGSGIAEQPIEWLWHPWIPAGKFVLLEGEPGRGKTTLAMDLLARLTSGEPFPGQTERRKPMRVLIAAPEDAAEDTLVPRLRVAGADLKGVGFYDVPNEAGIALPWTLDRLDDLVADVREHGVRFVYVDALMTAFGTRAKVDTHRDADVRVHLNRLAGALAEAGAQVLATRHLRKGEKSSALEAGIGSVAFAGVARAVLLLGRDIDAPDDPSRAILAKTKGNLGPPARSRRFRIVEAEPGVTRGVWGEECDHTADAIVSWTPDRERRGHERRACFRWLADWWGHRREARVADVKAAAEAQGRTWDQKTWRRACEDCGLRWRSGRGDRMGVWFNPLFTEGA